MLDDPPYGRDIGKWMRKAWESAQEGATVVCLVPARTCSRWWHDYAAKGDVLFLRGRLRFGDGENSAPFPSALVVFCNDILPKRYIKQCVICDDLFAAERTHAKVCGNRCRVRQHRQQQ